MIELHDKETGALVTAIDEAELALLVGILEEEDSEDQDYYLDGPTLQLLGDAGFNKDILHTIGRALGDREGMEVVWTRLPD